MYHCMTNSETELQQTEKYASIYLKISDIVVILDIPTDVLRTDIDIVTARNRERSLQFIGNGR